MTQNDNSLFCQIDDGVMLCIVFCCSQLLNKWCNLFICLVASITCQLSRILTTSPLNKFNLAVLLKFKNTTAETFKQYVCTNTTSFTVSMLYCCWLGFHVCIYRTQSHILLNLLLHLLVIDTDGCAWSSSGICTKTHLLCYLSWMDGRQPSWHSSQ